jgi:hypothetical protein
MTNLNSRSWHGDCFLDEESSVWKRLEVSDDRSNRDKPGISGNGRSILVAGGTTTDEAVHKQRSKLVERFVIFTSIFLRKCQQFRQDCINRIKPVTCIEKSFTIVIFDRYESTIVEPLL